jgi:hypothetical protein
MSKTCGECVHFDYYLLSSKEDDGRITHSKDPDLGYCMSLAPFWCQGIIPMLSSNEREAEDCSCFKKVD